MSGWTHGCGVRLRAYTPRGREYNVQCGSTSPSGGVHQCMKCERLIGQPPPPEVDEGDLEYDHRINGGN